MLTPEQKEIIFQKAKALARNQLAVRRRLERSEVSPRRAKELLVQAESELKNLLEKMV